MTRWAAALGLAALLAAVPAAAQGPPVAARDLPRGAVLKAGDVTGGAGVPAVVGWITRRVVSAGEPLRPPAVAPPDLVRTGEAVQLVWRSGAVELRLAGRAMGSGAVGERVMVRVDTQRRFQGTVVGPALVRIDTPERSRQ